METWFRIAPLELCGTLNTEPTPTPRERKGPRVDAHAHAAHTQCTRDGFRDSESLSIAFTHQFPPRGGWVVIITTYVVRGTYYVHVYTCVRVRGSLETEEGGEKEALSILTEDSRYIYTTRTRYYYVQVLSTACVNGGISP